MKRIVLPGKATSEVQKVTVDFLSSLAIGESISSASTSAAVYSGTDATPSGVISGIASISGSQVTQTITGGTSGVIYELTFTAVTSAGQTLKLAGYLSVL